MRKSNTYVIQFRPLDITTVEFARRKQKSKYSSLESLNACGLVKQLQPEEERDFVQILVDTHPAYEKNFGHFLVSPPDGIKPTEVLKALRKRTRIIPTLCIVQTQNGRVLHIERVKTYHKLMELVSDAKCDGVIQNEESIC